jgi:hypothetical protein
MSPSCGRRQPSPLDGEQHVELGAVGRPDDVGGLVDGQAGAQPADGLEVPGSIYDDYRFSVRRWPDAGADRGVRSFEEEGQLSCCFLAFGQAT